MPSPERPDRCPRCSRPLLWARTINDGHIALDPEPTLSGNLHVLAGMVNLIPPNRRAKYLRLFKLHNALCGLNG